MTKRGITHLATTGRAGAVLMRSYFHPCAPVNMAGSSLSTAEEKVFDGYLLDEDSTDSDDDLDSLSGTELDTLPGDSPASTLIPPSELLRSSS